MHLSRLDIFGFKSFANKTSLEFEKPDSKSQGVTAIVGPNGSGKSNIADALRWVLGEQSLKLLRSKKSEDVLFAGSKQKSKSGAAIVSIYLDNSDKSLPLDYNPVIITRKIFRSGESEYLINKSKVRLLDVGELLAKAGIGQRSYCIISQGMADRVLNATLEERRNILEDASGVKPFEIKKQQSQRKIQATLRNLTRVSDLLKEIKPRLNTLSKQAEKASRKKEVQEELIAKQKIWYSDLLSRNILKKQEFETKLQSLQKEILNLEKETLGFEKNIQKTNQSLKNFSQEKNILEEKIYALQTQRNSFNQEITILRSKIQIDSPSTKINLVDLTTQAQSIDIKIQENLDLSQKIDSKLKLLIQDKENQKKEISLLNQDLEKSKLAINQVKTKISKNISLQEVKTFLENIYLLQTNLTEALSQTNSLDTLTNLSQKSKEILHKIKKLLSSVSSEPVNQSQKEINHFEKKLNDFFSTKDKLNSKLNLLNIEIAKLESEKNTYAAQTEKLEKEKKKLLEEISTFKKSSKKTISKALQDQEAKLGKELSQTEKQITELKANVLKLEEEEYSQKKAFFDLEKKYHEKHTALSLLKQKEQDLLIEQTKIIALCENLSGEIKQILGSAFLNSINPQKNTQSIDALTLENRISRLKTQLQQIGEIDPLVVEEFNDTKKRFEYLTNQSQDLDATIDSLKKIIKELDQKIENLFEESFKKINLAFDKYFKILFDGGIAKLELVEVPRFKKEEDEEENEEEETKLGIEIKAIPPGKRIKSLNLLSGGERSLASLALLFAIISQNPPPFSILDEVEASLDEANSYRFGKILRELSSKTQFIIITHNRETMRQANTIYGVTMQEHGVSQLLSIKISELEKITKSA
jgi:chromosome segregation protein